MSTWNDFNNADTQSAYSLIPKGTVVRVRMTIRPGGYNDPAQGWTGGYATYGDKSGSVYLNGEFTVLEGPYAKRKVFTLIGLFSTKGPDWGNKGRSLIRGMLNSARGLSDKDTSPQAQAARRINGIGDLDGIEFLAKIDIGKDTNGEDKNEIRLAVTPDHKEYGTYFGSGNSASLPVQGQAAPAPASAPAQPQAARPAAGARPSWAQ